ncbi:hypothetical protein K469DRAFT_238650 [Zopfia rhizophila CBS 207.26]|uniref:Uncharacterized protein n=1 Tax=Zopfia rhizophila CBS 207.26 TaxID=1314779 RepID=A0A6A6ES14_9PEZI|nr:hypothetical protein K469DRAFT_238650 [Zopfia rhizophila CBS 207.26]
MLLLGFASNFTLHQPCKLCGLCSVLLIQLCGYQTIETPSKRPFPCYLYEQCHHHTEINMPASSIMKLESS